jgi:hypothetical protein
LTSWFPGSRRRIPMKKPTGGNPAGAKRGSVAYVPDTGHMVWFSCWPQAKREQAGRRPALILSPVPTMHGQDFASSAQSPVRSKTIPSRWQCRMASRFPVLCSATI